MQRKENTRSNGGFSRTLKLWLLPAVLMIFLAAGTMMSQKVYAGSGISPGDHYASDLAGTNNYSTSGAYDTITVIMDQDLSLWSLKVDGYDLRFIADPGKDRKTLTFNAKNTALQSIQMAV